MKINLARALKEKNRLINRIADWDNKIRKFNTYVIGNDSIPSEKMVDISDIFTKRMEAVDKMASLKASIAKANAESGIVDLVFKMEELKTYILFLKKIDVDTTPRKEYCGDTIVCTEVCAQIDREFVESEIDKTQIAIEECQDEIDELNGTTFIEINL